MVSGPIPMKKDRLRIYRILAKKLLLKTPTKRQPKRVALNNKTYYTWKHTNKSRPNKINWKILIYKKMNKAKFGPSEELYDMEVDVEPTIKEVINKLDEAFISGELEPNQYCIYKGGREPQILL